MKQYIDGKYVGRVKLSPTMSRKARKKSIKRIRRDTRLLTKLTEV